MLGAFASDFRYALRRLRSAPAVSATIIITMALGVGANAAVFSLADRLLRRAPSGIAHPEELRRLYARSNWSIGEVTEIHPEIGYPQFSAVASAVGARVQFATYTKPDSIVVGTNDARTSVRGMYVDSAFFPVLGVRIARGRSFTGEETRFGNPTHVAVISHTYWQRHFNGDPNIVGARAVFDRDAYTIIGVTAQGFRGPDLDATDAWLPLSVRRGETATPWYQNWRSPIGVRVVARVAPATTDAWLAAVATTAFRNGELENRPSNPDTATVVPGSIIESLGPSVTPRTEVAIMSRLMGVSIALLLVACANVANLLLARAMSRRREIAVRLALGVSRSRLASQLLVESVTLSLVAGAAAALAGAWTGGTLARIILPGTQLAGNVMDARMVAFTFAIAIVTGVIAGVAPALHAARSDVAGALKGATRGRSQTQRLRPAFVVAQTALSLVLIVGAGLFARSLRDARAIDVGYDVDRLVWGTVSFYDPQRRAVVRNSEAHALMLAEGLREAKARLERAPTVERVALSANGPMAGFSMIRLYTDAGAVPRLDNRDPALIATTPAYFTTTGLALRRGRLFSEADNLATPPVILVNETAARAYWPGREALGECLRFPTPTSPCLRVVGITEDARLSSIIEPRTAQVIIPIAQRAEKFWANPSILVVRARPGEAASAATTMRETLRAIFPTAEPPMVRTVAERLEPQLRPWILGAVLFGVFGALALLVAGVGVYSAMAYSVSERTRELGIRVAIGASGTRVVKLIVGEATQAVVLGIIVGIALAIAGARLVETMLYATSPRDPFVIAGASVILMGVALAASAVPAWRASRADPMVALRSEG